MKIFLKLFVIFCLFYNFNNSWAAPALCSEMSCDTHNTIPGCQSYVCYGQGVNDMSCAQCYSGYTRTNSGLATTEDGECSFYRYTCSDSESCLSDMYWTAGNTGYQLKINRRLIGDDCVESTVYRCASGYYGSSSNGTSGCYSCKTKTANTNSTSVAGDNSTIGKCFVPAGTYTDSTGTYIYSSACYYTAN